MRRLVRIIAWTMIWSGTFILGYVGFELYGTDLINDQIQAEARSDLPDILEARAEQVEELPVEQPDPSEPAAPSLVEEPAVIDGEAFAALSIPRIDLSQVVFEGVDRETLTLGPGHIPETALPGQPGNAVLSGHRTTNGRPFFDLDLLTPGDEIIVETAVGVHTYAVREMIVVTPFDVWVTEHRDGAWLTLTTCNPKFSARERLVVFAEMTSGPNFDYVDAA
ncbi:MAG: sortase [Acidimicrobiia bacterium]|nr:sortase [Acidimicrobiia bacterium]MDH4306641.1 sortase [Acidimicrobiia bacterium]MDH5295448.1 sortase [Acidimicrobiia bacterium]